MFAIESNLIESMQTVERFRENFVVIQCDLTKSVSKPAKRVLIGLDHLQLGANSLSLSLPLLFFFFFFFFIFIFFFFFFSFSLLISSTHNDFVHYSKRKAVLGTKNKFTILKCSLSQRLLYQKVLTLQKPRKIRDRKKSLVSRDVQYIS